VPYAILTRHTTLGGKAWQSVSWLVLGEATREATALALEKDAPDPRAVHDRDPGEVIAFPEVGGLHHRYERRAA